MSSGGNYRDMALGFTSAMGLSAALFWYHSQQQRKRDDTHEAGTDPEPCAEVPTIPIPQLKSDKFSFNFDSEYDNIYVQHGPKPFQFNREVVRVFDDMISRSVPLYRECMYTLLYWVFRYYKPNTVVYDLGASTGSTIDFVAHFLDAPTRFVGVDNSEAMVEKAREKLAWMDGSPHACEMVHGDLMDQEIVDGSVVIMNYTLQFIAVSKRKELLQKIFDGLVPGGILFISEKVRSEFAELQETCTWIYEDFKHRRGYTKTEIARKKEALMNVLVPYTERELISMLEQVGFSACQIVLKWNNFTTFVAVKSRETDAHAGSSAAAAGMAKQTESPASASNGDSTAVVEKEHHYLESLFQEYPVYLGDMLEDAARVAARRKMKKIGRGTARASNKTSNAQGGGHLNQQRFQELLKFRSEYFYSRSTRAAKNFEKAAECLCKLPKFQTSHVKIADDSVLEIGLAEELTEEADRATLEEFLALMRPWKKGPLRLFGTLIDTEWRSDWKWNRLVEHVDNVDGKVVADLGCANGYFMYRLLEKQNPQMVVGIDPNFKAWLEFEFFQRFAQKPNLRFEIMDGDCMGMMEQAFDCVFCLGVLYHTTDPLGMLKKIWTSMKPGGQLIVDCQGIAGEDPMALFPRGRYANAKGIWFLPTVKALEFWLLRSNFRDVEVFYSEPLSLEEQRATPEWANVKSLKEALSEEDQSRTIEGYPAPHRFYVKCKRG